MSQLKLKTRFLKSITFKQTNTGENKANKSLLKPSN